jgi:hypothetical protein
MGANWTADDMYELGTRHARLETERQLDPLMQTLIENPVYEFHPIGLRMSGGDRVRRYYAQFFTSFMESIAGYKLLGEWVSEHSVVQEYDIEVELDGVRESHRVIGILFAEGELLGGERVYGSERVVRLMLGGLFEELEPIE